MWINLQNFAQRSRLRIADGWRREPIIEGFHLLLGLALLARIAGDWQIGRWHIHKGELVPWRQLDFLLPLAPPWVLALEWLGMGLGAFALITGIQRKWAARLLVLVLAFSLTQMFQNQKALLWLIFLCLAFFGVESSQSNHQLGRWLLRWQLLIVYAFAVIQKGMQGFTDGDTLRSLAEAVTTSPHSSVIERFGSGFLLEPRISQSVSIGTVAIQALLPIALLRFPETGLAGVLVFHLGMAMILPDILPFSLAMIALGSLFLTRKRTAIMQ